MGKLQISPSLRPSLFLSYANNPRDIIYMCMTCTVRNTKRRHRQTLVRAQGCLQIEGFKDIKAAYASNVVRVSSVECTAKRRVQASSSLLRAPTTASTKSTKGNNRIPGHSPPPFYKHFTAANISALKDAQEKLAAEGKDELSGGYKTAPPKKQKDASPFPTTLTPTQLLDLPAPLREQLAYLIPPSPPTPDVEYRVFGKPTKLGGDDPFEYIMQYVRDRLWNPETQQGTLPFWEYTRLYPSPSAPSSLKADSNEAQVNTTTEIEAWGSLDRQNYLFRFLRSILLKHIELLGIFATDPTAPATPLRVVFPDNPFNPGEPTYDKAKDKVLRDILTLVMNMHALINEYRPHQARETLIRVLEGQVERKKAEIEGVKRMSGKIAEALEELRSAGDQGDVDVEITEDGVEVDEERLAQRDMWTVLDKELL
ncbi:unnamed protein product [Periconia digitata]|uniref:Mediator of RNA polymerase II transcription subunit 7 n=1 Tax=Periconia digitata TaxID=1303443 RepID=A0A9W4XHB0_9PLEO|nr:unnamed protein product [Periconia digitata]